MSIISLLAIPTEFGLPQLVTREVAAAQARQEWARLSGIIKWSRSASLSVSVVVAAGVLVWLLGSGKSMNTPVYATIVIGLTLIPFVALGKLMGATLRGLHYIVRGQVGDVLIRPLMFSILLLIASVLTESLAPAAAMGLGSISAAAAVIVTAVLLRPVLPRDVVAATPESSPRAWWSAAIPMAMAEGMRILQSHLVILFLASMLAMSVVGAYRVASSIALVVAAPVSMLSVVAAPAIAALYARGDTRRLQRLLTATSRWMVFGAALTTLPFVLAGRWLIEKIFGSDYVPALPALQVICLGMVLSSAFGACAALLNMTGNQKCVTKASAASLALLCTTLPFLIVSFGMVGAAAASALSLVTWSFIMWLYARRILGLDASIISVATKAF